MTDGRESAGAHPKVLSKNEARQGVTGHNVRYVLTLSLGGVVVVFGVIYLLFIH